MDLRSEKQTASRSASPKQDTAGPRPLSSPAPGLKAFWRFERSGTDWLSSVISLRSIFPDSVNPSVNSICCRRPRWERSSCRLVREWDLGPVHLVAQDVGTSAALWAAASSPALVRSLVIGGGGTAVPLQVGGSLKDIIEAPDMEGFRQIDSSEILGPTYDAMAGGPLPPDVRDDYLESYAGDRFVESARYVRTYPTELPALAEILPSIETPVQIVCGHDDPLVPMANQEFLHERLPNSRMDLLPAGHFAWEEVPDLYGDVLVRWLSGGYREPRT